MIESTVSYRNSRLLRTVKAAPVKLIPCWRCGKDFPKHELQDHLNTKHPGWQFVMLKKMGFRFG